MTDAQMAGVLRTITDRLTPVASLPRVPARVARWAVLSALSILTVTWVVEPRGDLIAAVPTFAVQVIIMGMMAALAAVAALRLAIPGADRQADRIWAAGVLALWPCGLLLLDLFEGGTMASLIAEPLHPTCAKTISMAALAPAVAMTIMIRRGATLRPWLAGAMAATAAAGVGAVGVAVTCPISSLAHLLIAHALPTMVVAGILSVATSLALRRKPVSRLAATVALFALVSITSPQNIAARSGAAELPPFRVAASTTGYVSSDAFLEFLRGAAAGVSQSQPFEGRGPLLIAAAILLGGLLLKLPPRLKQVLAVCILISAAYYGYEAFTFARPHEAAREIAADAWYQSLDEGLAAARREGKPVFLDVWATWCKNCVVMDATTFKDPKVREALDHYIRVRFQADDIERPDVAALLDRLDSVGLPTYAVLRPAAP